MLYSKKIMTLQLFILISGQIFKMFQYLKQTKKAFEMLLETEIKNTICTADQKELRLLRYLVDILFLKTKRNDLARPVMGTIFLVIGRAKRAPHWGVQSRFRVIYICIYMYVGMSRMSN